MLVTIILFLSVILVTYGLLKSNIIYDILLNSEVHNNNIKIISMMLEPKIYEIFYKFSHTVFNNTKSDKILLLYAINKKTDFQYATAFLQFKKNDLHVVYKNIKIDDWYRNMLYEIEKHDHAIYEVKNMPKSILKAIYDSEEEHIKYVYIKFLKRIHLNKDHDFVLYSSIATQSDLNYTQNEIDLIISETDILQTKIDGIKFKIDTVSK